MAKRSTVTRIAESIDGIPHETIIIVPISKTEISIRDSVYGDIVITKEGSPFIKSARTDHLLSKYGHLIMQKREDVKKEKKLSNESSLS